MLNGYNRYDNTQELETSKASLTTQTGVCSDMQAAMHHTHNPNDPQAGVGQRSNSQCDCSGSAYL